MKPAAVMLMSLILCACTGAGHYDAGDFQLMNLKSAVARLFDAPVSGNRIEKRWWPAEINELHPESVIKNEKGIYIRLDSFFVEESGLFIPLPGTVIGPDVHSDPGYRLLGVGIYSYHITG